MIVLTVLEPNGISIWFKNCHHHYIPFTVRGNGNIVFSVQVLWSMYQQQKLHTIFTDLKNILITGSGVTSARTTQSFICLPCSLLIYCYANLFIAKVIRKSLALLHRKFIYYKSNKRQFSSLELLHHKLIYYKSNKRKFSLLLYYTANLFIPKVISKSLTLLDCWGGVCYYVIYISL